MTGNLGAPQRPPLAGLRVLDFTHVLAGPFATGQLALMGAEVIRIERPGQGPSADFVRRHGGTEAMRAEGLGASFLSQNAGKRSVVLDLKDEAGRAAALELAETADIIVENFRPGVMDRLGLTHTAFCARRADVIHASLTGFGPDGPWAGRPAYDHILQGMSGLMAMTGTPESGPMRVGLPIVDYVAGQALVTAILGALVQRANVPGVSQRLHVSMLDAITGMMGAYAAHHQTTGVERGTEGNRAFSDSPYSGRFDCAEGHLVVTANTALQAERLRDAIGRPDLAEAPDAAVEEALKAAFRGAGARDWEARLAEAGVPAARVRRMSEVLTEVEAAGMPGWHPMPVPELGLEVRVPGLPFRAPWGPATGAPVPPAPTLGRDTAAVLGEIHERTAP